MGGRTARAQTCASRPPGAAREPGTTAGTGWLHARPKPVPSALGTTAFTLRLWRACQRCSVQQGARRGVRGSAHSLGFWGARKQAQASCDAARMLALD